MSPVSGVKVAVRVDSEEAELSSNMTLHWSDDDDDVTVKHLRDDHIIFTPVQSRLIVVVTCDRCSPCVAAGGVPQPSVSCRDGPGHKSFRTDRVQLQVHKRLNIFICLLLCPLDVSSHLHILQ